MEEHFKVAPGDRIINCATDVISISGENSMTMIHQHESGINIKYCLPTMPW